MKPLTLPLLFTAIFWILLGVSIRSCRGQTLLVPAYNPDIALRVIRESKTAIVIANPNSGAGWKRDKQWSKVFREGQQRVYAYVDLLAWKQDGWSGDRKKTVDDLRSESKRYRELYGQTQGWFFDDAHKASPEIRNYLLQWGGEKIWNAGTRAPQFAGYTIIMHESPGFLSAWLPEPAEQRSQCGAIALDCPPSQLSEALLKAHGLRYFYAHDRPDQWRAKPGQPAKTAFDVLPMYWDLLTRVLP